MLVYAPKPTKILDLKNKQLKLYNQFPRCYQNIGQATQQLPSIAAMGFNVVWVNPLQSTAKQKVARYFPENEKPSMVNGSIYAMFDPQKLNSDFFQENPEVELATYTKTARDNGLMPIFDLVLNHLAIDSPLVSNDAKLLSEYNIKTSEWFQKDSRWDDVCQFKYDDPVIAEQIVTHLWKPYIKKYISEYGFMGARIDAARLIPPNVQKELYDYIKQCVAETYGVEPIIFAEILYTPQESFDAMLQLHDKLGITHMTNDFYWTNSNLNNWQQTNEKYFRQNNLSERYKIATVGFAGSHDEDTLFVHALKILAQPYINISESEIKVTAQQLAERYQSENIPMVDVKTLNKYAKKHLELKKAFQLYQQKVIPADDILEKMKILVALAALSSNGGYYLMSGDEYASTLRKNVFTTEEIISNYKSENPGFNERMIPFVTDVNLILDQMQQSQNLSVNVLNTNNKDFINVIRYDKDSLKPVELVVFCLNHRSTSKISPQELLEQWCQLNQLPVNLECISQCKIINNCPDKIICDRTTLTAKTLLKSYHSKPSCDIKQDQDGASVVDLQGTITKKP